MAKNIQIIANELLKRANLGNFCNIMPLPQSGSAREYFRIFCDSDTYILCVSDNKEENHTFISLNRYFHSQAVPVPRILAVTPDESSYLLQDLGSVQLLDILHSANVDLCELYRLKKEVFEALARMQFLPEIGWSEKVGFQPFDSDLIKYDFNYSYTQFISRFDIEYNRLTLNSEFDRLESRILSFPNYLWGFMFRDFQSRNIMIHQSRPWFIDFQSGRKGPCIYDFVSFAWQARAGFSPEQRKEMLLLYTISLERRGFEKVGAILNDYIPYFASFRLLQVLGAYGLRGLTEGKPHFLASIPPALKEFRDLLESTSLHTEFPTLSSIITQLHSLHSD